MKRILKACLLGAVLVGAVLAVVFGCQGRGCFTFFYHRGPELRFALAASALPEDGMWKSAPVFADVNGDGFPDLAALPRLGNGARVWLGDGKGTWRDASEGLGLPFSCGGGVAFGDVNNDGHLDLVVADHCAGVFVYLGDGKGHWKESAGPLNPAASQHKRSAEAEDEVDELGGGEDVAVVNIGAEDVAVGDVSEDGFMDLVVASSDKAGITVYFGDGSGKFWKEATSDGLPKSDWANKILLQDIDGDGHLDVVASYSEGPRVWRGDGKGHFQPYSRGLPISTAGGYYRGLAVGDVNEDGRLDIAVANIRTGPEIYLQTKDGAWQPTPPLQSSIKGGATALALGDLDGDGHLDLVVGGHQLSASNQYGLFVFRGNGKAEWTELQGTNLPLKELTFIWGVALADVNDDGVPDLAVTTGVAPVKRKKSELLPRMQVWINQYRKGSPKP